MKVCRSPFLLQSGEDQIAPRLEVERRDDQFAETGLPEILEQQLGISAAQIHGRRLLRRCWPAEHVPQRRAEVPQPWLGAPGCSDQPGPPSASIAMTWRHHQSQRRHCQHTKRDAQTQRDQSGHQSRQRIRRERVPHEVGVRHGKSIPGVHIDHLNEKAQRIRHQPGRQHEKRDSQDRDGQKDEHHRPLQRRAPRVQTNRRPPAPDAAHPPRFSAPHRSRRTTRRPRQRHGRSSRRSSRRPRAARAARRRDTPRPFRCR